MAVQGIQPFIEVYDSNGDPIVGAKLYVYEAETTTPRDIYSDDGLTTPLSNPLTGVNASDASGKFPRFYMAAGLYKLRAETSGSVLIWEYDNLDTGMSAGAGALPIASGGTGATTASQARDNLDVPSNSELADLSSDISDLTSVIQNIVSQPQGYLTPTSATPVIITGVAAGTALYYTPMVGNLIPIWNGALFEVASFSELTLSMHANHLASQIYDVFVWKESGVVTIGTGPAWNTPTAGSGARGSGSGTTELVRVGGLWTNAQTITTRNGGTTYTVGVSRGTYVGSIFMDGTNGQISCLTAYGQSRKWSIWNAYNRKKIFLQVGDSTAAWTYGSATVRQSNGAAGNTGTVFCGLPEERATARFRQNISTNTNGESARIGIGLNVTNAFTGFVGKLYMPSGATSGLQTASVELIIDPALGINNLNCVENLPGASGAGNYAGGSDDMLMTIEWWG
jgi:hypothetical protein